MTVIGWFEAQAEPLRTVLLTNHMEQKNHNSHQYCTSIFEAINSGMTWSSCNEPEDMWNEIYEKKSLSFFDPNRKCRTVLDIILEQPKKLRNRLLTLIDEMMFERKAEDIFYIIRYYIGKDDTVEGGAFWDKILESKDVSLFEKYIYAPKSTEPRVIPISGGIYKLTGSWTGYGLEGVQMHKSPFGNCQNFSIVHANNLIKLGEQCFKKMIGLCAVKAGKRMCLIDIRQNYVASVRKYIPDNIVFTHPYTSTNGSAMELVMIRVPDDRYGA